MIVRPQPLRTRPTVSVVVPCYNYGHYLPGAVQSALAQPSVSVEVIVVDDASPDGSAEVARSLAAADPRVTAIVHPQNAGHIATYNDGLRRAQGDYVVLLSADDLLAPGSLSRSVALMEARPEVGLVYGYAPEFSDVVPTSSERVRSWSVWSGEAWLRRVCRRGTNVVVNPEAILRGSVLRELEGYDPRLPHTADMDLWMRAALIGDVGRVNGPHQAYYRVHGGNMHLNDFSGLLADMNERWRGFEEFFDRHREVLHDAEALRDDARRSIAYEAVRAARVTSDDAMAEQLTQLSLRCYPAVTSSAPWRGWAWRDRGPAPMARRAMASRVQDLRWRYRWRRWRRYGT